MASMRSSAAYREQANVCTDSAWICGQTVVQTYDDHALIGEAYRELGRLEEAIGCYQQSLAIFRETGDRHSEGLPLNNLGLAYGGLRRFEEAITCYQQDIAICRETGDRHGEGRDPEQPRPRLRGAAAV